MHHWIWTQSLKLSNRRTDRGTILHLLWLCVEHWLHDRLAVRVVDLLSISIKHRSHLRLHHTRLLLDRDTHWLTRIHLLLRLLCNCLGEILVIFFLLLSLANWSNS